MNRGSIIASEIDEDYRLKKIYEKKKNKKCTEKYTEKETEK